MHCCRPDVLQAGESDLSTVGQLMRFVFLSNFTGHPAISLPAGHDYQGSVHVFSSQSIRFWQLPTYAKLCFSSNVTDALVAMVIAVLWYVGCTLLCWISLTSYDVHGMLFTTDLEMILTVFLQAYQ